MNQGKIAIVIIHYNTPHYLKGCLDAIFKQTYKNFEVFFIDNNSPDKSGIDIVKNEFGHHKNLYIFENEDNSGYSGAANQGITLALDGENTAASKTFNWPTEKAHQDADFVVITNPDILYSPSYFEKVIARINKDPKIAGITGKVYKYDFENQKATKIIDTVGLIAFKNRRIIDDGQGILDEGQFNKEKEVFGISGACPLYRAEALRDTQIMGEYLDDDFFMYKEDVDLSWRFQLFGWKCLFYPKAVAFHGRGTGIFKRFSLWQTITKRTKLSRFQKMYSFKNQLLMQSKNELWGNFFRNFPSIFFRRILTPIYITFCEPYLWKSYFDYFRQLPQILKKRKIIMKRKRVTAKQMAKWFVRKTSYLNK